MKRIPYRKRQQFDGLGLLALAAFAWFIHLILWKLPH